ncbi:MAG: carboxypeptidase regulatory-like domain-containing protein, partial [Salinibacterium sp.]|nr:carboxypeptidase regulatory-like domain-containing protein [Salinibacterium sp.]
MPPAPIDVRRGSKPSVAESEGRDTGAVHSVLHRASLTGRVEDEGGQGLVGAKVVFEYAGPETGPAATTDADGRFGLSSPLPDGPLDLVARTTDGRFAVLRGVFAGDTNCLIKVADAPQIRGRVSTPEGQGIPGAEVALRSYQQGEHASRTTSTLTDAEGLYALRGTALLPGEAGAVFLDVNAEGFAPSRDDLARWGELRRFRPDDVLEHDVLLGRGRRLSGRVVMDLDDRPGAGADVVLHRRLGSGVHRIVDEHGITRTQSSPLGPEVLMRTVADEDGRFCLDGVPRESDARDDHRYILEAGVDGHPRAGMEVPPGGYLDIELRVLPGIRLTGRVLDPTGEALTGAWVSLRVRTARMVWIQINGSFSGECGLENAWSPGKGEGNLRALSDPDGRFAFPPVPAPVLNSS